MKHYIQPAAEAVDAPTVVVEKAKNGEWTSYVNVEGSAPFYMHSRYDPIVEAQRFSQAHIQHILKGEYDRIIIYGAACCHHVKEILQDTALQQLEIEVWETNCGLFQQNEQRGVYASVWDDPRIRFIVADSLHIFSQRVELWNDENVYVIVHEPSLKAMPKTLEQLKSVLKDYQIHQNSVLAFHDLLLENFERNTQKKWPSLSPFQDKFHVPILLVSAGPSLEKSLPHLAVASKHCLIGAVGTALKPLLLRNIRPDFVVMTDPKPEMVKQISGVEQEQIPLFFLSTACSEVVEQYSGPKFILYQEGYPFAEQEAMKHGEILVKTGGSVSTTLFSLARILGCHPICLIGQDLAYTNNQTHMEGTPLYRQWTQDVKGELVTSFDRKGSVIAPRNLLLYKKWFEEQARNAEEVFYNATEGGAYIEGFHHLALVDFIEMQQGFNAVDARRSVHSIIQEYS
ncbi:motility associated factor glycosyltransferase family protein [Brevibacillus sp. GCM10020057]|uniref:motility associated factor glycosyltransferase family protein n=1 Tax=Brevibacillus sp. GCM10020057 TaxID=3317327 RepID=UPI00362751B7